MKIHYQCIPCSITNFIRLIDSGMIPPDLQEKIFRRLLIFFAEADYSLSPPALGRQMHRILREELNDPDPYIKVKQDSNKKMLRMLPYLEDIVHKSPDPFRAALRLAIAGNVIDFGSHHRLDILETINAIITAPLAVDHSDLLRADLQQAKTVLYIGDNAGEIVLDKIFIETIDHPRLYFAVREKPVLNDALEQDARELGLDALTTLITTGDDAPGVILETSSSAFRNVFKSADVIISKGQGNYEGLSAEKTNIYFLLVTKCALVASHIGVPEKAFVVLGQNHRSA